MTLDECKVGMRVKTPGSFAGTIDMVSTRLKRHPIWVLLDTGQLLSFAPEQLAKAEEAQQQSQVRPVP